jgi:hypothetical protein
MKTTTLRLAACALLLGTSFLTRLHAADPPLFMNDGAIPNASVQVGVWLENLDAQPDSFRAADLPFVVKDSTGALIVAQDSTLRKFVYSEELGQWLYEWQRVYFSNEVNASAYITPPTEQNPNPPRRYNTTYLEYWSNESTTLTLKYQPGNNGNSSASTPLAQYQYIDFPFTEEIDERDKLLSDNSSHGSDYISVSGLQIDAANNIYVALRTAGRESTLVTKFSPTGDVLWRELTVPGGDSDGKEDLAGDNLIAFELSPSGDKLYTVEAETDYYPNLNFYQNSEASYSALQAKGKSYRRSVFLTADDTGPSPRRTTFYGGIASAYRVAISVIPFPGWTNNTQYRHQYPMRAERDGLGNFHVLFRESDPASMTGPDGEVPQNVVEDRTVVRMFDANWNPLAPKLEFLDVGNYLPTDIQASADGSLYVLLNFRGTGLDTLAVVRRYQVNGSGESAAFEQVWSRDAGPNTYAQQLVLRDGTLTAFGDDTQSGVWQVSRFTTAGVFSWLRTTPPYSSRTQRYRTTTSIEKGWVDPAGNALLIGSYTDYLPTTGNTITPQEFCYAKYAADGDLQFIRLLGNEKLEPYNSAGINVDSAIFHGDLLVVPAMLKKPDENGPEGDLFDYPGVLLAFANPANVDVPPFEITNSSVINADPFTRNAYIDLTTNRPAWDFTVTTPGPFTAGGALVGNDYFPSFGGAPDDYGFYQVTVYAFGANGTASKEFTINVTPGPVTTGGEPVSQTVQYNASANLQFFANGQNVIYQWQRGTSATGPWTNVSGGTDSLLLVKNIRSKAHYRCRAFNKIGNAVFSEVYSRSVTVEPDKEKPEIFISSPKSGTTKAKNTKIKGAGIDNLAVSSVKFRYKSGKGKYGTMKEATLAAGSTLRQFTASVPTGTKGVYTIEFTAVDSSGNVAKKNYTLTRN